MTPLPVIPFTTEEITDSTTEPAKGANVTTRNLPSCSFISCSTLSVTPSINASESSNDFAILIILSTSSFKMNKMNPFPALTTPFPPAFLSNLFTSFKTILLTNSGKLALSKEIATLVSAFSPNLSNQEPKDPLDCIILDI